MDVTYSIFIVLLFGLIGAAIGETKNRAGAGFFFGLLLGPLGWLLVAIGPDYRPQGKKAAAETAPAPKRTPPSASAVDGLLVLKRLLDAGAITQAEFEAKKQALMESL